MHLPHQVLVIGLLLIWPSFAEAGPKVRLGRHWNRDSYISTNQINYGGYDAVLTRYVDQFGDVDYSTWVDSATDLQALDQFIDHLSQADPRRPSSREAQLAFWINAYNAVTLKGILREYPTSSIRKHTAKLYGYNIWHDLLLLAGGTEYSLDQMEHQILRNLGDPRIHFAIVCASRSCPMLRSEAYVPGKLEKQLSDSTHSFFASPYNFKYDVAERRMELSMILKWYGEDFGSDERQLLRNISNYLPHREAQLLALRGKVRVTYLAYDWGLNDQKKKDSVPSR